MASRGSKRKRRPRLASSNLEALANQGMLRAVHGWISTRKGWHRQDKAEALAALEDVLDLIEENEQGED